MESSSLECSLDLSVKKRKLDESLEPHNDNDKEHTSETSPTELDASELKKVASAQNGINTKVSDQKVEEENEINNDKDDQLDDQNDENLSPSEEDGLSKSEDKSINNEDQESANNEAETNKSSDANSVSDHLTNGKDTSSTHENMDVQDAESADHNHNHNNDLEKSNDAVVNEDDDQLMDTVENDELSMIVPSPKLKELTEDEIERRNETFERLQNELSNEETKLLLLRKIQNSQAKENQAQKEKKEKILLQQQQNKLQQQAAKNVANLVGSNLNNHVHLSRPLNVQQQQQQQQQLNTHHLLANNLNNLSQLRNHRTTQNLSRSSVNQLNFAGQSLMNGIAGRNAGNSLGRNSPHLQVNNNVLRRNNANSLINNNISNLMLGLQNQLSQRANNSSPSPLGNAAQTKSSLAQENTTSAVKQQQATIPPSDFLTPVQQQAAKQTLKKQIEKTLTSITPPKPISQDITFIPNAQNQEFIYYFGLETVVDFLTEPSEKQTSATNENQPPESAIKEPLLCAQCGTDFSPSWKFKELTTTDTKQKLKDRKIKEEKQTLSESNGADQNNKEDTLDESMSNEEKSEVLCESCVTSNLKRKIKAEHAQRLKNVFALAIQQEKEMETKIAAMVAAQQEAQLQQQLAAKQAVAAAAAAAAQQAKEQREAELKRASQTPPNVTPPLAKQLNQIQQLVQQQQLRSQLQQQQQQQQNASLQRQSSHQSSQQQMSKASKSSSNNSSNQQQSSNKQANLIAQLNALGMNANSLNTLVQIVAMANGDQQQLATFLMNSHQILGVTPSVALNAIQILQQAQQAQQQAQQQQNNNQRQQQQQSNHSSSSNSSKNLSNHQNSHNSSSNRNNHHHNEAQQSGSNNSSSQHHSSTASASASSSKRSRESRNDNRGDMQPPAAVAAAQQLLNSNNSGSSNSNNNSNSSRVQQALVKNFVIRQLQQQQQQQQQSQKAAGSQGLAPGLLAQFQQAQQLHQLQQAQNIIAQVGQLAPQQQQQIMQLIASDPSNLNLLVNGLGKNNLSDLFGRR